MIDLPATAAPALMHERSWIAVWFNDAANGKNASGAESRVALPVPFSTRLTHLTLPEILDFNTSNEARCVRLNQKRCKDRKLCAAELFAARMMSQEGQGGMASFVEKRTPDWAVG